MVVLFAPTKIADLGDYYDDFPEVSDEQIAASLAIHGKVIGGRPDKTAA